MIDKDLIGGIRQALQDVVAPEVRELRGDIRAISARFDALETIQQARFSEVNAKLDALLSPHNLEVRVAKLESRSA